MWPELLFVFLQLSALLLATPLAGQPELQEYKPELITDNPEKDAANITGLVIAGTIVLVILKLLGISLAFLIDLAVFASGVYLALMLSMPMLSLPLGLLLALIRRTDNIILFNISTAASVLTFSLLFGAFISTETSLLLLSAMSVYDSIAVLYTKHMRFLWFQVSSKSRAIFRQSLDRFRRSLVFLFPVGENFSVIGSGDFSLPLIFTVTLAMKSLLSGFLAAAFGTLGFILLQTVSAHTMKTRETGVPGVPFISLGCALGALAAAVFRPI